MPAATNNCGCSANTIFTLLHVSFRQTFSFLLLLLLSTASFQTPGASDGVFIEVGRSKNEREKNGS
jgi:hypothetical protein